MLTEAEMRTRILKRNEEGEFYSIPGNPKVYAEIRAYLAKTLAPLRTVEWSDAVASLLTSDSWYLSAITEQEVFLEGENDAELKLEFKYPALLGAGTGEGSMISLSDFPQSYFFHRYRHLFGK